MSSPVWRVFPFPTLAGGVLTPGSVIDVHPDCRACATRPCSRDEEALPGEVKLCRWGLSYSRVDEERVVVGLVATGDVPANSRSKKRLRQERQRHVPAAQLRRSVVTARELGPGVAEDFELHRREVMARLESDPKMNAAVMERIGRQLNLSLQQSHDFVQLAKLVGGYAEELLRAIDPSQDVRLTAEQHEVEGSIYFATEMMVQKIDALFYLQDPLAARTRGRAFQVHPLILKYLRVYQWKANQKNLSLAMTGECRETVFYDPQAIGAVAQSLLDNLVKYAPAGSYATVNFEVRGGTIEISFNSLGPRILPQELARIFSIGVRGEAARTIEESGQGVGLATARQVSDVLDLGLSVNQEADEASRFPGHFSTTFSITLKAGQGY